MGIPGIEQPEFIYVDNEIRLRKFDGDFDFALRWYQDEDTVYLVDGVKNKYTAERLEKMYHYLNNAGELYFIEALNKGQFVPIGDVTFWKEDLPIVIGVPGYRGKGIGRKVISSLIERGRHLGYSSLKVGEIYNWNPGSRRCFEHVGFRPCGKTENGMRYILYL